MIRKLVLAGLATAAISGGGLAAAAQANAATTPTQAPTISTIATWGGGGWGGCCDDGWGRRGRNSIRNNNVNVNRVNVRLNFRGHNRFNRWNDDCCDDWGGGWGRGCDDWGGGWGDDCC